MGDECESQNLSTSLIKERKAQRISFSHDRGL